MYTHFPFSLVVFARQKLHSLLSILLFRPLELSRRQKAIHGQATDVEINLFNLPALLDLPLVIIRLPIPVQRRGSFTAVRYVNPVDVFVILDHGFHACFPEDAVVPFDGLHPHQLCVLKLDEEPCALAEIAPHCVVDDFGVGCALCFQDVGGRLKLEYEAIFVVEGFLSDADRI
jgi:hypothetical protein